jgi:glucosamine-6-phosphate deaminase
MNVVSYPTRDALSIAAARDIAAVVAVKPDASLVLATGNTPMGAYAELARMRAAGTFDASRLRIFQLDAYLGIALDDPRSLYGWLKRSFLDPLGIAPGQVTMLPDDAKDPDAACAAFERAAAEAGPFDISVLGLGPNGHLGFNEPPSPADAPTRRVPLSTASLVSNAVYWDGRAVPREAITCGMNLLLAAQRTLLLVAGAHKREILRQTLEGPVTPNVPASLLRQAQNVTIYADTPALSGLL